MYLFGGSVRRRGEQSHGSQRACLPFGNSLCRSLVHSSVSEAETALALKTMLPVSDWKSSSLMVNTYVIAMGSACTFGSVPDSHPRKNKPFYSDQFHWHLSCPLCPGPRSIQVSSDGQSPGCCPRKPCCGCGRASVQKDGSGNLGTICLWVSVQSILLRDWFYLSSHPSAHYQL